MAIRLSSRFFNESIILASERRKSNLYSDDIFDDKNLLYFSVETIIIFRKGRRENIKKYTTTEISRKIAIAHMIVIYAVEYKNSINENI